MCQLSSDLLLLHYNIGWTEVPGLCSQKAVIAVCVFNPSHCPSSRPADTVPFEIRLQTLPHGVKLVLQAAVLNTA